MEATAMGLHVRRPDRAEYGTPDFDLLEESFLGAYAIEATRDGYRDDLDFYACWCHQRGLDPLRTVRADLELFARSMENTGYAPRTRDRRLRVVHLFFQRLIEDELATTDPTVRVKRPRIPRESSAIGLSVRELADILKAAEASQWPAEYALICLLEFNGLRNAEVCSLNIEALGTFRGSMTMTLTIKGGEVVTDRLAPITGFAVQQAIVGRSSGPVLLNRYGHRMTGNNLRDVCARLGREAGVPHRVVPHSFRHSVVTLLRDADVSDRNLMILTHHRDPRMVPYYDRGTRNLLRHPTDLAAAQVLAAM